MLLPEISVAMPVYNGARWLREAIESVLAQSHENFELVIVDDGSTDVTPSLLDDYSKRDKRIRVIRQCHLGLTAALNRALAEARAPLLARLDADDRAIPARFEQQLRFLVERPDFGLVGSWAREIDANGFVRRLRTPKTEPRKLSELLMAANPFLHSSVMMRTQLVRRLGAYRQAFEAAEDYDLWLRISEICKVAILPEFLIDYRWHPENVTNRKAIRQAFSFRLAQRSAKARRASGSDPAEVLREPPDWNAPDSDALFYAGDAALYRLLSAAVNAPASLVKQLDLSLLLEHAPTLSNSERKLAAHTMLRFVQCGDMRDRELWRVIFQFLRERPRFLVKGFWSMARDSFRGRSRF